MKTRVSGDTRMRIRYKPREILVDKIFHLKCCPAFIYELKTEHKIRIQPCNKKDGICCECCPSRCKAPCGGGDCGVKIPYFLGQKILRMRKYPRGYTSFQRFTSEIRDEYERKREVSREGI